MKPRPVKSKYLVPTDGSFRLKDAATKPPKDARDDDENEARLRESVERLDELQKILYADDRWSVLAIFQAMDAAGKDGTIRAVLRGVNPAGVQVTSFKQPSTEELDHDFLWRVTRACPERGRIGVFNRSHYEEVLVVRVHPEVLEKQRLPRKMALPDLWKERYASIRDLEHHLARSGTRIVKFWLNVSKDEQRRRFLDRMKEPESHWKYNAGDLSERERWDEYMEAYEDALRATSRDHAPWYAIPADDKKYMRRVVADILVRTMESLDLAYPEPGAREKAEMKKALRALEKT